MHDRLPGTTGPCRKRQPVAATHTPRPTWGAAALHDHPSDAAVRLTRQPAQQSPSCYQTHARNDGTPIKAAPPRVPGMTTLPARLRVQPYYAPRHSCRLLWHSPSPGTPPPSRHIRLPQGEPHIRTHNCIQSRSQEVHKQWT